MTEYSIYSQNNFPEVLPISIEVISIEHFSTTVNQKLYKRKMNLISHDHKNQISMSLQ
jgi:hypothetical protein